MIGLPANQRHLRWCPLVPLCLAAFAGFLNLFGLNPFFAEIARDLDTSVSLVGYSATSAMLTTAVAGVVVGLMIDRVGGAHRILVAGLFVAGISALLTALATGVDGLMASRVLAGVGGSITGGVTVAAAATIYQGQQRQRAMAFVTASMAMAVVIGVFLMTSLAEPFGWRGSYVALGLSLFAIGVLNVAMPPPKRQASPVTGGVTQGSWLGPYRALFGHGALRWLFLAACLHPAVMNGSTAYLGAMLEANHGLSTQSIGLVFSLIGATYFVGNVLAGHLGDRRADSIFPIGITLMGTFWFLGYVLPLSPVVSAIAVALATLAGGLSWVALLSAIAARGSKNLASAMILASSLLSLGAALGIATGAALLDITGNNGIAAGMSLMAFGAAVSGLFGGRSRSCRSDLANEQRYGLLKTRHSASLLEADDREGSAPSR